MASPSKLLVLVALAAAAWPAGASELRAGVAEADVTPEVGVPLAGYGSRLRRPGPDLNPFDAHALFEPSRGVRDPIEAQALVLEEAGRAPIVLLTVDAVGVERALLEDVAGAAAAAGVPLAPERLLMAASHTHSGPGALSRRLLWQVAATDRFQRRVHRRFVARCAELIAAAWVARRPARLAVASGPVPGVSRNRRADDSTLVEPDDVDPTLRLLRVDDAVTGEPLAALLNFAVHPTCLPDDDLRFSADVVGEVRRQAARRLGCPVLFTNGAEGDVSPRPGGEEGLRVVGARLGAAAAALAPSARPLPDTGLGLATTVRDLGPLRLHPELGQGLEGPLAVLARLLRPLDGRVREPVLSTRFRYTALRLGDAVLLCVPGEPIVAVGARLQARAREAGFRDAWVLGLANGHMGYVATPEEYRQGGYEAWMTFYGEDTAERVEEAFGDVLRRLAPH